MPGGFLGGWKQMSLRIFEYCADAILNARYAVNVKKPLPLGKFGETSFNQIFARFGGIQNR
jgi:hypothetical protein